MKLFKKIVLYTLLVILLGAGIYTVNFLWFKPFSINHFYNKIFMEFALDNPELSTGLGIPVLSDWYNDQLTDASLEFNDYQNDKTRGYLKMLLSYDKSALSEEEKVHYETMQWFLEDAVAAMPFDFHNYPINQMTGMHISLANMMQTSHNIVDEEDAEAYIIRLNAFREKFAQLNEGLDKREELGIIPPISIIDVTVNAMKKFIEIPHLENSLYTSFKSKIDTLGAIDDERREQFLTSCEEALRESVYPQWEMIIDRYEKWKNEKATNDAGVWKFPDGDKYYAYQVRSHTTTDLTPEEVHQIGLDEVARISTEMRAILEGEDLNDTTQTIGTIITQLNTDERFTYENTDEGRQQSIRDYQEIIDHINNNLDDVFGLRPPDNVEVKRIPEFREAGSALAYYQPPALDGSRPGAFYINLQDMGAIVKFGMKTLAYHEAVPGHHFQISIQRNLKDVPFFRTILPFTVYSEGWGLYAEQVAFEQGFYENDPFGNLGRLQSEMFRAVRLVVDSGIHHKRWTREEAIEYMIDNTGMTRDEVVTEIERYMIMPGQALAYKIGMLKILEFREKAKTALNDRFNIKEFHDVILGSGSMPMTILERIVDNWIADKLAA